MIPSAFLHFNYIGRGREKQLLLFVTGRAAAVRLLPLLFAALILSCCAAPARQPAPAAPHSVGFSAATARSRDAAGPQSGLFFYGRSCLKDGELALYDLLDDALRGWNTGKRLELPVPLDAQALKRVWNSVLYDHPVYDWARCVYPDTDGLITCCILEPRAGLTVEAARARSREIERAADQLLAGIGGSDFEIAVAVHDALLQRITYEQGAQDADAGSVYGGLVRGRGVCDAYSRSYQYLLQRMGIACCYITGMSGRGIAHSWNAVLLEDGWYYVDITWDDVPDEKGYLFHDYLLVHPRELASDHFPDTEPYGKLPPAGTGQFNYYIQNGFFVNAQAGQDPVPSIARAFSDQLSTRELTDEKRPVFLEIRVDGDPEQYTRWRDAFNEHLFDILKEMQRLASEGGLPFEIETTGSVAYHFNDSTRVLTLFPKASLPAQESVEKGA